MLPVVHQETPLADQETVAICGRKRVRKTIEHLLAMLETRMEMHRHHISWHLSTLGLLEGFQFFISFPRGEQGTLSSIIQQKFDVRASLFSIASCEIETAYKIDARLAVAQLRRNARDFVFTCEELIFQKLKGYLDSTGEDYRTEEPFSTVMVADLFFKDKRGDFSYFSRDNPHPGFPAVLRSLDENRMLYPKDWVKKRIE